MTGEVEAVRVGPVMEVVAMEVDPRRRAGFSDVLTHALEVLQLAPGYLGHAFGPCVEEEDKYFLLIRWDSLEAHVRDFRGSAAFEVWRSRLAGHLASAPTVRHFRSASEFAGLG